MHQPDEKCTKCDWTGYIEELKPIKFRSKNAIGTLLFCPRCKSETQSINYKESNNE